MRIIAGKFKGRQIKAARGEVTRPTTDKIKENVFNIMGQFFDGGQALDLFAGSGNLAIEAISRGIDNAVLVDKNQLAIKTIKENVAHLNIQDKTEIYRNDAFKALNVLGKRQHAFDLIFLDPPYGKISITSLLADILKQQLLNKGGLIMCEFGIDEDVQFDPSQLMEIRREVYGNIEILILEKVGA